ncbi:protein rolling stone-like [Tubulanus polymorphus]|uniref:protein rolling stone-like n=1 Tax=Tubulanus polymorphus TaxID=672921 RepID=UPI003DA66421
MGKDHYDCCLNCLDREFHPSNIGLKYQYPTDFVRSQWPRLKPNIYCIFRVVLALGFLVWLITNIVEEIEWFYPEKPHLWFTYATNWSFFILCLSFIFRAILTLYYDVCNKEVLQQRDSLTVGLQCSWLFNTIAWNISIVVSICFWVFIITMDTSWYFQTTGSEIKHSLGAILVIIDLFISGDPVRLLHFVYPISLGLFYIGFNALYFALRGEGPKGNHLLYKVLDWTRPGVVVVTIILTLICSILVQVLLHELFRLRWLIFKSMYPDLAANRELHGPNEEMTNILGSQDVSDANNYDSTDSRKEN